MADDNQIFRPSRKKVTNEDLGTNAPQEGDPLEGVKKVQEAIAKETGKEVAQPFSQAEVPFEISGNVPPEFRQAMQQKQAGEDTQTQSEDEGFEAFEAPPDRPRRQTKKRRNKSNKAVSDSQIRLQGSDQLEGLLQTLADKHQWEEFSFPSGSKFYDEIPESIQIRAMTGEEEQILATPRWVRKGKAIDMIFRRCIRENINTEDLLSVDRTHLLIYLRGISYTPDYDVEIKCPACSVRFSTIIDLNALEVDACPANFDEDALLGELPTSGFHYTYRLATGGDEQEISAYRERRIQQWGDQSEDDTLLYRTALLLNEIEGVTQKKELALLLKKLPINDVAHLRNEINEPPFGVDTEVPMVCPSCSEEFDIDLPLETNFFFPRKKEERVPA